MRLVAACVCRNELHRYAEPCIAHLLEFVDEVRIYDDGSTDGWQEALRPGWGKHGTRVLVKEGHTRTDGALAFNNHAAARSALLSFTLEAIPDFILPIDLDEFVSDGAAIRQACEQATRAQTLSLAMEEAWEACDDRLCIREDGGWASHAVTMLWRPLPRRPYQIQDKGHATGRTPQGIVGGEVVGECLHFGWTNRAERAARYARYAQGDGGRFHSRPHIESIMYPDSRVVCRSRPWPEALEPWREELLRRSGALVAA